MLATCQNDGQHAGEVVQHARRYIEETRPDIVVSAYQTELIYCKIFMVHMSNTARPDDMAAAVTILGVRVDRVSRSQVLDAIERMISLSYARANANEHPPCQQIITVNPL